MAESTPQPALNVKALGTDFGRAADGETVGRALLRLTAALGEPFGRDEIMMRQMAAEWQSALSDMPAVTINNAVSQWLKRENKWPKPADIRKIADAVVQARVSEVSASKNMHPHRLNLPEALIGFKFKRSLLRLNPTWAEFLDTISPMHEHCFFGDATMGLLAHEVKNMSQFEIDFAFKTWGDKLASLFKSPLEFRAIRARG